MVTLTKDEFRRHDTATNLYWDARKHLAVASFFWGILAVLTPFAAAGGVAWQIWGDSSPRMWWVTGCLIASLPITSTAAGVTNWLRFRLGEQSPPKEEFAGTDRKERKAS